MKKTLAFIAGFAIAFIGMVFVFSQLRVMIRGPITVSLCVAGGLIASWLVDHPKFALKPLRSKWWGAAYGFRLATFAATLWLVGAFIWLDSYDRSVGLMLGPVVAIFAVYYGYKHLVVGSSTSNREQEALAIAGIPIEEKVPAAKDQEQHVSNSADRAPSKEKTINRRTNGTLASQYARWLG